MITKTFPSPSANFLRQDTLSRNLLGVPLGSHWLSGAGAVSAHGAVFIGVLAVLAAACWLAARSARRALPQTALATWRRAARASSPQALTAVTKVLPYLTVVIAAFAPLAGAIYLITSTGWSAAERHVFAARTARSLANQPEAKPSMPAQGAESTRNRRRRLLGYAEAFGVDAPDGDASGRLARPDDRSPAADARTVFRMQKRSPG